MRKPTRVDAFDAGFYSHAVTVDVNPRVKNALDNCLLSIGLGKYDPLLFERLEKIVAGNKEELHKWFQIGSWLHFELSHFEKYSGSQWSGHSLTGQFRRVGIDPESSRTLLEKIDAFCKNKKYINKKQDRAVVKYIGIKMDLNTPPAVAIVEDLRDIAREQDEREAEAVAKAQSEHLSRPVQVHFHRDVLGTVNLGSVQGSIYSSVAELSRTAATQRIAETLKHLTDAVNHNDEIAPEHKIEVLQTIETLGEQAKLPESERKSSTFKAALAYLPTLLNSAETASKLWETFGPSLKAFFN